MASMRIVCKYPYGKKDESEVILFADSPIKFVGENALFDIDGKMKIIPINSIIRIEAV